MRELTTMPETLLLPEAQTEDKPKRKKRAPKLTSVPVDQESAMIALKLAVKNFYDIQTLRMQIAGRHNKKTGPQTQLTESALAQLRDQTESMEKLEHGALVFMRQKLKDVGFYRVLKNVPGVGEPTAAVILTMFDIHKADTVSKMWAFAGLRPVPCLRCRRCNQIVTEKGDTLVHQARRGAVLRDDEGKVLRGADGEPQREEILLKCATTVSRDDVYESGRGQKPTAGEKLPYSAFLRAKLLGGIGPVIVKGGRFPALQPMRKMYDDYKHRLQTGGKGVSDGHRHAMAVRYVVKHLLLDIWKQWREFEGLPVRPSYHEEKQGGHGFNGR